MPHEIARKLHLRADLRELLTCPGHEACCTLSCNKCKRQSTFQPIPHARYIARRDSRACMCMAAASSAMHDPRLAMVRHSPTVAKTKLTKCVAQRARPHNTDHCCVLPMHCNGRALTVAACQCMAGDHSSHAACGDSASPLIMIRI